MTRGQLEYFRVLSKLVGAYEDVRFPFVPVTPIEALKYLMQENNLSNREMAEILGCRQNRVSEILSNIRELSKEHIARLGARFNVSTDLFLRPLLKKAS
jgi:HTH-type transcriptional regulator/antitoxin HigA